MQLVWFFIIINLLYQIDAWLSIATTRRRSSLSAVPRKRPVRPTQATETTNNITTAHEKALNDPTLLSDTTFDRPDISPESRRAIHELGYRQMTQIQHDTWNLARNGTSIVAQAKTGSGKTLAFLLPVIERIATGQVPGYRSQQTIGAVIIAPTRELVKQIADQAESLLKYHRDLTVLALYGGTKMGGDRRKLDRMPTILVVTPGRIVDHLRETRIGTRRFGDLFTSAGILVLDEADKLLEGYPREMETIISSLPRENQRQTLLFSATFPKKLNERYQRVLPNNHIQVRRRIEVGQQNTKEYYTMLPSMKYFVVALESLLRRIRKENPKARVLVFFPTARLVKFFTAYFNECLGENILEVHSRMSQASRERASQSFRRPGSKIMFSSDVSARGIDYPDVTHVVQYGCPDKYKSYIHRVGRVGRAGSSGDSVLCMMPFERDWLSPLSSRSCLEQLNWELDIEGKSERLPLSIGSDLYDKGIAAIISFVAYYERRDKDTSVLLDASTDLFQLVTGLSSDAFREVLPETIREKLYKSS